MVCYEALLSVWYRAVHGGSMWERVVHGGSIVLVQSQDDSGSGYGWSRRPELQTGM